MDSTTAENAVNLPPHTTPPGLARPLGQRPQGQGWRVAALRMHAARVGISITALLAATACMLGTRAAPEVGRAPGRRSGARPPIPGAPAGVTAFVDVAVVPMDTDRVLPHQTMLVQNGRIAALGPAGEVRVPPGAVEIDGRDKFLIPGLADCHMHIGVSLSQPTRSGPDSTLPADSVARLRLLQWLGDGVTTIRNLDYMEPGHGSRYASFLLHGTDVLRLRAQAAAGELWAPRIYAAGQWAPGHYTNFDATFGGLKDLPAPNLDSVPIYVAAYQAAGYDVLKVHEETPAVFDAVLAAARRVGIPVVGHVTGSLDAALAGGMQSIEHMTGYPSDEALSDRQARALALATRRAGVWNCVTMQAGGGGHAKLVRALQDAGAGLLLGSDFPIGVSVHRELEILVKEAGLTPYQALATGTRNFAAYLRASDETGTLAVGKRADLVLLEANPLQEIAAVARRAGVMIGGRWLSRDELDRRLLAYPKYWLATELRRADIGRLRNSLARFSDLSDSLALAKSNPSESARLVRSLAEELGALRASLEPEQQNAFDPIARAWLRVQTLDGYRVSVPGVAPVP